MLRRYFVLKNVWVFDNGRVLIYSDGRCGVNHTVCTGWAGGNTMSRRCGGGKSGHCACVPVKKPCGSAAAEALLSAAAEPCESVCVCVSRQIHLLFKSRRQRRTTDEKHTHGGGTQVIGRVRLFFRSSLLPFRSFFSSLTGR